MFDSIKTTSPAITHARVGGFNGLEVKMFIMIPVYYLKK